MFLIKNKIFYFLIKKQNYIIFVFETHRKPTEIEWRFTEEGKEVRVSKRTGRVIPIPNSDKETIDYKLPSLYKPGDKDTKKEEVEKITFKVQY